MAAQGTQKNGDGGLAFCDESVGDLFGKGLIGIGELTRQAHDRIVIA